MDKKLKDKLWTERNGIVWKAIEALKAMYSRHGSCSAFCYCREGEKLKRQYMGVAEPSVQDFIDEYCLLSPEERAWTSVLYDEYKAYCRENGLDPVGRKQFGQMIYSIPSVHFIILMLLQSNSICTEQYRMYICPQLKSMSYGIIFASNECKQ